VTCYRIVLAENACTPVSVACGLLGVSTSGYYPWASRVPSDRKLADAWLVERITALHAENRGVYGSRRVTAELRLGQGVVVSRKRVQRLMRIAGLSGLIARKRGRTTIRVPGVRVADDLVERRFRPAAPDVLWVADITYLRTWEGWVYLAAVQDAFSRRIVGWSMADHMRAELVVDAPRWPCTAAGRVPGSFITPTRARRGLPRLQGPLQRPTTGPLTPPEQTAPRGAPPTLARAPPRSRDRSSCGPKARSSWAVRRRCSASGERSWPEGAPRRPRSPRRASGAAGSLSCRARGGSLQSTGRNGRTRTRARPAGALESVVLED